MNQDKEEKPEQNTEQKKTWLVQFQISDALFALYLENIRELIHMAELIVPPGLPSFINGFVNIDGMAIPVVSLAVLMGLPVPGIALYTPLVITHMKPTGVAFIVDKVLSIENIKNNCLYPLDDNMIFNQCVSKSGQNSHGDTFHLLSLERILVAQEKKTIMEFQATEQKRLNELKNED